MLKNFNLNQILQQMPGLLPNYCDRCGNKHNKADLEVVNQDSEKILCKLTCTSCGSIYVIHINSPSEGVIAAKKSSFKTDVSASEIKKFSSTDQINKDEILDVFIALEEVNTLSDFTYLLDSESSI